MAIYKRGGVFWYEFIFAGKRIRESAKTSRKTVAAEAERNRRLELEKTLAGIPVDKRESRIRSVNDIIERYQAHYSLNHRDQSVSFSSARVAHVKRVLGAMLLPDVDEDAIRCYIRTRVAEGVSGRTVNMEVGELSRAIGKPLSVLWPKVRKMEERKDAGRALTGGEERRLLDATSSNRSANRSPLLGVILRIALLTGMRSGEITSLTWGQVDFARRLISVGRAKTASGTGRQIPMNQDLFALLSAHADWFTGQFGETKPERYLFPFGRPMPMDPARCITTLKTSWNALRTAAGVDCPFHDLRHTAATKMAEAGTPESTMLALMGHMSRAILERYSHIRMAAKRSAVEALALGEAEMATCEGKEQGSSIEVPTKIPTAELSTRIQ